MTTSAPQRKRDLDLVERGVDGAVTPVAWGADRFADTPALDKQPGPTVSPAGLLIEGRARRREHDGSPALESRRPPDVTPSPGSVGAQAAPSRAAACGGAE